MGILNTQSFVGYILTLGDLFSNMAKKERVIFSLLLLVCFYLRSFHMRELMGFDYDQEVAAFPIENILNGKLTLIGQEISVGGIFIGPGFYYLLAIFYLLFGGDPIGAGVMVALFSLVTMTLLFIITKLLFDKKTAFISLLLYATNFLMVVNDRTTAPSNFVMLMTLICVSLALKISHGVRSLFPWLFLAL